MKKLANVTPINEKGQKEDPGKHRPVSLTSVAGKAAQEIILSAIMQHMRDKWGIRPSHHGFTKSKLVGVGQCSSEQEPVVFPCCQQSQNHPGLHQDSVASMTREVIVAL